MPGSNVPDDWSSHYRTCSRCSRRYHASEGCGCDELSDEEIERAQDLESDRSDARAEAAREERGAVWDAPTASDFL